MLGGIVMSGNQQTTATQERCCECEGGCPEVAEPKVRLCWTCEKEGCVPFTRPANRHGCTGASCCTAAMHRHGCDADHFGLCDDPAQHDPERRRPFLNGRTKPIEPIVGCSDCNGYGYHGHTNPNLGDRCSSCEGTGLDNGSTCEVAP